MSRQREGDTGRQTDVVGRDIEWRRYIVVVLSMHVCDVFSCCTRTEAGSSFCEECTLPLAYSLASGHPVLIAARLHVNAVISERVSVGPVVALAPELLRFERCVYSRKKIELCPGRVRARG